MTIREVAERLGVSDDTVRRLVARGDFPAPVYVSERSPRWAFSAVTQWLENRARTQAAGA